MQRGFGHVVSDGHLSQVGVAPVATVRRGHGGRGHAFQVKVECFAQLVHVYFVQELFGVPGVVGYGQVAEHVVGRNLEALDDGDFLGAAVGPFVLGDVVVNARESFHKTVVGRDFVVQRVDDTVFDDGHEGAGFEDRTRFALASDGHVQHLVHPPRGGVAQEVHHGADGSRFDIQHHHATAFDVFVLGDVAAQGFVCDILQVDVEGGAHVHAVHGLFVSFLEILDPAAVIRGAEPHLAFGPVQDIVEFSFQADVVVAVGVAVVLYVADGAAGQRAVRILARIFLFDDHAALVLAFAEERKPLYGLEGFVIDHVP